MKGLEIPLSPVMRAVGVILIGVGLSVAVGIAAGAIGSDCITYQEADKADSIMVVDRNKTHPWLKEINLFSKIHVML